jgi:hypothetical protein
MTLSEDVSTPTARVATSARRNAPAPAPEFQHRIGRLHTAQHESDLGVQVLILPRRRQLIALQQAIG